MRPILTYYLWLLLCNSRVERSRQAVGPVKPKISTLWPFTEDLVGRMNANTSPEPLASSRRDPCSLPQPRSRRLHPAAHHPLQWAVSRTKHSFTRPQLCMGRSSWPLRVTNSPSCKAHVCPSSPARGSLKTTPHPAPTNKAE